MAATGTHERARGDGFHACVLTAVVAAVLAAAMPALAQELPSTRAPAAGTLYEYVVDRQGSSLFVVTHKAGLFGFLGHEHAIVPGEWRATLCMDLPVPQSAHGSITIPTAALVVDSDSARALAGLGDGPGPDDRAEIRRTLLGPEYLSADQHPRITLEVDSTNATPEEGLLAHARLTVRGVARDVVVPLVADSSVEGAARFEGTLEIRQSDFGMSPQSVAGVVNVADEVDLHFALLANRTDRVCRPGRN